MSEKCCENEDHKDLPEDDHHYNYGTLYWCRSCGALVSWFHGIQTIERPKQPVRVK